MSTIKIRARSSNAPFRRAGLFFGIVREWVEAEMAETAEDADRLLALVADPAITVEVQVPKLTGEPVWSPVTQAEGKALAYLVEQGKALIAQFEAEADTPVDPEPELTPEPEQPSAPPSEPEPVTAPEGAAPEIPPAEQTEAEPPKSTDLMSEERGGEETPLPPPPAEADVAEPASETAPVPPPAKVKAKSRNQGQ